MGQVCSGEVAEPRKAGIFEDVASTVDATHGFPASSMQQQQQQQDDYSQHPHHSQYNPVAAADPSSDGPATSHISEEEIERLRVLREEQTRLEMIISKAGRGMISVRSTRGHTLYSDQGFGAALAKHLEETTTFRDELEIRLPPSSSHGGVVSSGSSSSTTTTSSVYSRLARPPWEGIQVGPGGTGLGGCSGENPSQYLDNVAESLLDSMIPARQQLFSGVKPIIENSL